MNDTIFALIRDPSPWALLGLLVTVAFMSLRVFLDYRKSMAELEINQDKKLQTVISAEAVDNLSQLLVQNFRVLNSYYAENLSQSRTSTLASISIAILGFIVIIAGILIAFIGKEALLGSVSSAAGIVSEAAALLFFRENKIFQAQMQDTLKRLVSTQYLMTSIALAKELSEERKADEIKSKNTHLRELVNILHSDDAPKK